MIFRLQIGPWSIGMFVTRWTIEQQRSLVERLLAAEAWDLIFTDAFFWPLAYPIVEQTGAPFIIITTAVIYPFEKRNRAIPKPISAAMLTEITYDVTSFWVRKVKSVATFLWGCAGAILCS